MSYRNKLIALTAATIAATVCLVAWTVSYMTRAAFERLDAQRTAALVAQFQREFTQRGTEVAHQVDGIAASKEMERLAFEISRAAPDYAAFVNEAEAIAPAYQLDFLELLTADGAIVSSAQWPARFGYKEAWVTQIPDWAGRGAILKQEELPDGSALALMVRSEEHTSELQSHS